MAVLTPLIMTRDNNGYVAYGLAFSVNKYSANITSGVATPLTVPDDAAKYLAVFSYEPGTNVWVANNATAAVAAGTTFAATTSDLNPPSREVAGGDVLSFITPDADANVGVSFYAIA